MADSKLKQLGVGRRHPSDPLFAAGDSLCRMFVREGIIDIDDAQLCHKVVPLFPCEAPGCKETFASLLDFEMHYNSRHRFICKECRKPLPTAHFLDLHISETHDSFFAASAERKPMYRCFVEECHVLSQDVSQRRKHCIETHNFPHDFRYDQSLKKGRNHNERKTDGSLGEAMMVDEDKEVKKQQKVKPIMFGHAKQGKTFYNLKPWHVKGKKDQKESSGEKSDISTGELMEALPS